jgi:hypothetical protein
MLTRERFAQDDGVLAVVVVLVAVLALLMVTVVSVVLPTFGVARTSQSGEQASAQVESGLSDALFRLDQLQDNVVNFCDITVPGEGPLPSALSSALKAAGLSQSQCLEGASPGASPLPGAPGLQWYVVSTVTPPAGINDEVRIVASAAVGGQSRTVTEYAYRSDSNVGIYSVTQFTGDGTLNQAGVYTVSGFPITALQSGTVDVGVGPNGFMSCNGLSTTTSIEEVPELGATAPTCQNVLPGNSILDPKDPVVCAQGQQSTLFAPCVSTASFATVDGTPASQTYCPLPGTGLPNPSGISSVASPGPNAVFDCLTGGNPVTLEDSTSDPNPAQPSPGCPSSTTPSLPYTIQGVPAKTVPAGSYYFDSTSVTIGNLDPCLFTNGPVNIFILPHNCTASGCPMYVPPSPSSTCPQAQNTVSTSLNVTGSYVNAASGSSPVFPKFYPGNPANLNVYWAGDWGGNGQTAYGFSMNKGSQSNPAVFDGNLYAPGANITMGGKGQILFGSVVDNCFIYNGSPTMYFVYPQHPTHFLSGWAVTHFSISP